MWIYCQNNRKSLLFIGWSLDHLQHYTLHIDSIHIKSTSKEVPEYRIVELNTIIYGI